MADCFLGIDLGTSSVKVLVVDGAGRIAGAGAAEYPTLQPERGAAEQHPEDWWRATVAATRRALADAGPRSGRTVRAIGLSGQMHGTVLLGAANEPLAPAIIWSDTRAAAEVREITARIGAQRLIELTGSPLAIGFQAATIRWLQNHRPELWRRTRRVLLPKDYLRWRLTWTLASEPSDGSGSLLLDVRRRAWAPELLEGLGIDRAQLPPIRASADLAGHLRPEAAADLGLPAGLPVATGGGDTPCAALGAGVVRPDTLLLTFSTGAQVLAPAESVRTDGRGRLHTFCNVLEPGEGRPGWYTMGATTVAGLALRWLRDDVFELSGSDAFERINALAAGAAPGADGLIFLPHLIGERSPHMNPAARAVFFGLTVRHGRAELVRAAIEGAAFSAYDAFLALRAVGAAPDRIVAAGGGARTPLWRRIVADLFGLPVLPLTTVDQSAVGAAILGAAALDAIDPLTAARSWSPRGEATEPNPAMTSRYRELFGLYQEAYRRLVDLFPRLVAATETDSR
jgi:xylulokinase